MKKLIVLGAFVLTATFATSCDKKTTETESTETETVVVPDENGTEVDTAKVETTTEVETTVDTTKVN